ncbi:MAG: OstA-like protein, partial [Mucinivorans sp.]
MRNYLVAAALFLGIVLLAWAQPPREKRVPDPPKKEQTQAQKEAALVDYKADVMLNRGDNIIRLVGNVIFHHNGAIIQCDSALRYDENRME